MKKMQRKNELLHNFLDENDLNIKFGNAFTLSQVTGGNGFRSELLGVMLKYPEYCNFNSESTIAFNYRYGSNQHLAITKTNIENPRNREEELLTKCYKMWKEFFSETSK